MKEADYMRGRRTITVLAVFWGACVLAGSSQTVRPKDLKSDSTRGKKIFTSTCAGCHGLDGKGGERAPNIADKASVQRLTDSQISHIIANGIPGTGMPGFPALAKPDTNALIAHLRTLQGIKTSARLPGDSERGRALFFGKARCSECHMIAGQGGFIGSDLSQYPGTHTVEQTRNAIASPAANNDRQVRWATATIRGGEKLVGRVRNEDNFSVQLQTLDGAFHFISKADIEGLEYDSKMLLHSDYGSTLTAAELNDIVSYVISVGNSGTPEVHRKPKAEQE